MLAYISEPDVARKILLHVGERAQAPPLAPARGPAPDLVDPLPDYGLAGTGLLETGASR